MNYIKKLAIGSAAIISASALMFGGAVSALTLFSTTTQQVKTFTVTVPYSQILTGNQTNSQSITLSKAAQFPARTEILSAYIDVLQPFGDDTSSDLGSSYAGQLYFRDTKHNVNKQMNGADISSTGIDSSYDDTGKDHFYLSDSPESVDIQVNQNSTLVNVTSLNKGSLKIIVSYINH
ncbi:MAG: hypothetical protein ABIQ04_00605 [Candidatus Saccharimonadales bacterium]